MECPVLNKTNKKPIRVFVATLLFAVLLSACAGTSLKPTAASKGPVGAEQRAAERLELIFSGDLAGAYQYLTPGFRSGISSLAWQRDFLSRRVQWSGGEVNGSECSEDVCKVKIIISYRIFSPVPGVTYLEEKENIVENWIWTEDNWYLLP